MYEARERVMEALTVQKSADRWALSCGNIPGSELRPNVNSGETLAGVKRVYKVTARGRLIAGLDILKTCVALMIGRNSRNVEPTGERWQDGEEERQFEDNFRRGATSLEVGADRLMNRLRASRRTVKVGATHGYDAIQRQLRPTQKALGPIGEIS